ncbi:MAG: IS5 family transposase, partial [Myxococcales bacterium]|nr:IS5 family transposase [Myxococcales bacterium]
DLSDAEWSLIEPFVPLQQPLFTETKYDRRNVIDGILYKLHTGCQWRLLPNDFPPWQSVAKYFYRYQRLGVWESLRAQLHRQVRLAEGRAEEPTLAVIDSQSVKVAGQGGERGFDAHKRVKSRKRSLAVDILGLLLTVYVCAASVQDRDTIPNLLTTVHKRYPTLKAALVDGAYNGEVVSRTSEQVGIQVQIAQRAVGERGFHVVPKRWVVERSIAWLNNWRQLSKEFDRTTASSQTWITIGFVDLMLGRLTAGVA